MNILLTGASGFLGSHVLTHLLTAGHHVVALGRHAPPVSPHPALVFSAADLTAPLRADAVSWEDIDAVIHLAASGVKASHREWADALAVNVVGTQHLLSAIELHALRRPRVLLARTFYEHLVKDAPEILENPYIATKAAAAAVAASWARHYAGSLTFATVFQLYGPGDDQGNVLSYAARQLIGKQLAQFGSGLGQRDWLFIDDAAAAFVAILNIPVPVGLSQIDIGSGKLISIRHMVEHLAQISGANPALLQFDASRDRPDVTLTLTAQNLPTAWRPAVTADEGLRRLLRSLSVPDSSTNSSPI